MWTLATATCSHAAPLHFALNMATLALLGPAVEGLTGTTEMLKLYTLGPAAPQCVGALGVCGVAEGGVWL